MTTSSYRDVPENDGRRKNAKPVIWTRTTHDGRAELTSKTEREKKNKEREKKDREIPHTGSPDSGNHDRRR